MRRTVTAAVRKVKNNWFQQKAKEIEGKVMKGVVGDAWKYIRDIKSGRAGLKPTKLSLQRRACKDGNNILALF